MVRLASERVLLIGDDRRELSDALARAVPAAQVTAVDSVFDGLAELGAAAGSTGPSASTTSASAAPYTAVLAAAEPIERRPEAAVRALRDLAGEGRLILFGPANMEVLSRKMLQFGCDDYLVLPADPDEIQEVFDTPPLRLPGGAAPPPTNGRPASAAPPAAPDAPHAPPPSAAPSVWRLPLADLFLDAQLHHPQDSVSEMLRSLNEALGPGMRLAYRSAADGAAAPGSTSQPLDEVRFTLSHAVRSAGEQSEPAGSLDLTLADADGAEEAAARHFLAQVALLLGKLVALQDRHSRLQKMAITDELTGVYNARYFRHFLTRIVEKARQLHFPVTLLLFDIDDFKKYNDQFGHGVGDEILKQTAALMKRCTREHDLVARIGGDEFAVVFWDKEGPRQPLHAEHGPHRPPQTPVQIFKRFQRLIASEEFPVLGPSGKGVLGISAGMAVFPYEAFDVPALIQEADRRLMQLAKKNGKNTLYIVGTDEPGTAPGE